MEKKEFNLEKEYTPLKEKYKLPDLKMLEEDFDLENLPDKETRFLLREIRKMIIDKISAYETLFETLINPSSPPMYVFSILRSIEEKDKEKIRSIYKKLSRLRIKAIALSAIYNEASEAEFIINSFKIWQELKKEIFDIFENFENNFEKENGSKRRDYYN